jgi:folate-binding Fe-S cluster repair protein YgfZ
MFAQFNRFSIQMTKKEAAKASHQGDCEKDVRTLRQQPKIRRQLAKINSELIKQELKEYGAWEDAELADKEMNEIRILWLAAGDIVDYVKKIPEKYKKVKQ